MIKLARKEENEALSDVNQQKLETAYDLADQYKAKIQGIFQSTFSS